MDLITKTVCGGRGEFLSPATHSHDEGLDLKGLDLVSPLLLLQDLCPSHSRQSALVLVSDKTVQHYNYNLLSSSKEAPNVRSTWINSIKSSLKLMHFYSPIPANSSNFTFIVDNITNITSHDIWKKNQLPAYTLRRLQWAGQCEFNFLGSDTITHAPRDPKRGQDGSISSSNLFANNWFCVFGVVNGLKMFSSPFSLKPHPFEKIHLAWKHSDSASKWCLNLP